MVRSSFKIEGFRVLIVLLEREYCIICLAWFLKELRELKIYLILNLCESDF